jgi:beta-lactamase regulating signal transducer with metallopeptidase domain/ketosteroid isomerase-like protein
MITLLAETTIKGSVLLLTAGILSLLLHRRSAAMRHAVWSAAMAGVLLIPLLSLLLPAIPLPSSRILTAVYQDLAPRTPQAVTRSAPHASEPSLRSGSGDAPIGNSGRRSPAQYLMMLWAAGALGLAGCFAAAGLRLAGMVRRGMPITEESIITLAQAVAQRLGVSLRGVRLRWSERDMTPLTWGLLRPTLVLPQACKDWDEERLRQVLVHELGHIQRRDILTQALANLATALYWFNPLVWAAARQMLVERERACDDLVLRHGARPSSYAHELLEIARAFGARWTASRISPAMARRSQISGRLLAVLDPDRRREGLGRRAAAGAGLAAAAIVIPLASLAPVPALSASSYQAVDLTTAKAELLASNAQWANAFRQRDFQALSSLYTTDTLVVTPSQPPARGRRAAADFYQHLMDNGVAAVEINSTEFYAIGDLVFEVGRSRFVTADAPTSPTGRYMTLWKQEEGQWRIHRDFGSMGDPDEIAPVLTANLGSRPAVPPRPTPATLDAAKRLYHDAFRRGDVETLSQLWTGNGGVFARAAMEHVLASGIRDYREDETEVFAGADTAVETGRAVLLDGAGNAVAAIRYITLWQRVNGAWLVHRDLTVPIGASGSALQ